MKLPGYGKTYHVGDNRALPVFGAGTVIAEEKIDGSQFKFAINDRAELSCSSRYHDLLHGSGDAQDAFKLAIESARDRLALLSPGLIYVAEFLRRPKHNGLRYSRVPSGHLILLDVLMDGGRMTYEEKAQEARRIDLEVVPRLFEGTVTTESWPELQKRLLAHDSVLGGTAIEGAVFKSTKSGDLRRAKLIGEKFREVTSRDGKAPKPGYMELEPILEYVRAERRWEKAAEKLRDSGELTGTARDIGPLMRLVNIDIDEELAGELQLLLWQAFRKRILKSATDGLAKWYKERIGC